jgi:hypothetical protein
VVFGEGPDQKSPLLAVDGKKGGHSKGRLARLHLKVAGVGEFAARSRGPIRVGIATSNTCHPDQGGMMDAARESFLDGQKQADAYGRARFLARSATQSDRPRMDAMGCSLNPGLRERHKLVADGRLPPCAIDSNPYLAEFHRFGSLYRSKNTERANLSSGYPQPVQKTTTAKCGFGMEA